MQSWSWSDSVMATGIILSTSQIGLLKLFLEDTEEPISSEIYLVHNACLVSKCNLKRPYIMPLLEQLDQAMVALGTTFLQRN